MADEWVLRCMWQNSCTLHNVVRAKLQHEISREIQSRINVPSFALIANNQSAIAT